MLHALEIHPKDSTHLYAGFDCEVITASSGLYETTDSGNTWQRASELNGKGVWSLAFSSSSRRVGAGTTVGVFLNEGTGWTRISPASNQELKPVVSLAFDPYDEEVLLAGTSHLPWRTVDGGKTWTSIHAGMLDDSDVFSISPDRNRKGLVYASACSGVYESIAGGTRWTRLPTPRGAFRAYLVVPDPHRPRVIFAATSAGLLRSMNGGAAWTKLTADIVHAVSFDPLTPRRVYIASLSSGVLASEDGGETFQPRNRGFANRQFRSFAESGKMMFAVAPSETGPAVFRTGDEGATWKSDAAWPKNIHHVSTTDRKPNVVVCSSLTSVYISNNEGETWTALPKFPGNRIVRVKATEHGVLAAGGAGVFAWTAASPTWSKVAIPRPVTVQDLFTGSDDFVALAAEGALLISTDAGRSWHACSDLPARDDLHSLAGIWGTNGFLLAGSSQGLLRSDDGCSSWSPVRQGISPETVSLVTIQGDQAPLAFAVQYGRVSVSDDRGRSWKPLSDKGRFGSFPRTLRVVAGAAGPQLFALFSGSGVMVQDLSLADLRNHPAGSRLQSQIVMREGD